MSECVCSACVCVLDGSAWVVKFMNISVYGMIGAGRKLCIVMHIRLCTDDMKFAS